MHSLTQSPWKVYAEKCQPVHSNTICEIQTDDPLLGGLLSIVIRSLTKSFYQRILVKLYAEKENSYPSLEFWLVSIKIFQSYWKKSERSFMAQEWCHLFRLECFDQKSRKSIYISSPPLGKFMAWNKLLSLRFSMWRPQTVPLHVLRMGRECSPQ